MARADGISPGAAALAREVAGTPSDPLVDELAGWLASSGAFRAFVDANRGKIRKKLRGATDPESRRDVRAELAVARALVGDRGVALVFEAYGSQQLGPDFTLVRGAARVNIEVTRLRREPTGSALGSAVLGKLRQFPPSAPNVLVLVVAGDVPASDVLAGAMRTIRTHADAKDDPFFAARGLDGSRGFWDRFRRLGAVFVASEAAPGAVAWVNPAARIAVPARELRSIERSLGAR